MGTPQILTTTTTTTTMLMMMTDNVQQSNHDYTGSFRHNKPYKKLRTIGYLIVKTMTRNTCWVGCPLQAAQVNVADTMEMTSSISPMRAMVPLKP